MVTSRHTRRGVNAGSQYPDVVGDPYAGQNKYRWINPDAFRRPLDGQYGTFHRNALRMPGIRNVDANGKPAVKVLNDGWTAVTRDKSLSAQCEHSIGVTEDGYEVFTASPQGLFQPPILG